MPKIMQVQQISTYNIIMHVCHSIIHLRLLHITLSTLQVYKVYCEKQPSATTHNDDTTINGEQATYYLDLLYAVLIR